MDNEPTPTPEEQAVAAALLAERAVLGAMMAGATEAASELLTPADFREYRNARIYDHLLELWGDRKPTTATYVLNRLAERNELTRGDTAIYLQELMAEACAWTEVPHFAAVVIEAADRRRTRALAERLGQLSKITDGTARRDQLAAVIAELGTLTQPAGRPEGIADRIPSVDWAAAYDVDFTHIDWLPGQFMERGQQVTLVGDGKVGKSLFALDWAISMASGTAFLAGDPAPPVRVLYLDRENSLRDIITRARAFGAKPADLAELVYKQFPALSGGLDSENRRAAGEVLTLVKYHRADVVVIDTVSRFISGKENDSDTWLQLYQALHAELKAAGVACLRLDHFGKDDTRGSRGSSAKSQDVDHVWELSKSGERITPVAGVEVITSRLKLARTHTRTGLGSDGFVIDRRGERRIAGMWVDGQTSHTLSDVGLVAAIRDEIDVIVDELIARHVPEPARIGRETLKKWMADQAMTGRSNGTMTAVVRRLHERAAMSETPCPVLPAF